MRRVLFRLCPTMLLTTMLLAGCVGSGGDGGGLKSSNSDVRRERVLELGGKKPWSSGGRKTLSDSLTAVGQSDPDPLVRSAALAALAKHDKAAARKLARGLLADEDATVRWDAVKVLSDSATNEARAALLYAVRNDSSNDVRRKATRGLGRFDDDEVVKELLELLNDPEVVVAACRSLQRISGLKLGTQPGPWQQWHDDRLSIPAPTSGGITPLPKQPGGRKKPKSVGRVSEAPVPAQNRDIDVEELRRHRR